MVLNLLKALADGIHFYKRERESSMRIIDRYIPGIAKDELAEAICCTIAFLSKTP